MRTARDVHISNIAGEDPANIGPVVSTRQSAATLVLTPIHACCCDRRRREALGRYRKKNKTPPRQARFKKKNIQPQAPPRVTNTVGIICNVWYKRVPDRFSKFILYYAYLTFHLQFFASNSLVLILFFLLSFLLYHFSCSVYLSIGSNSHLFLWISLIFIRASPSGTQKTERRKERQTGHDA
jgi:hypothetical protein